jgi:hypothetical protein
VGVTTNKIVLTDAEKAAAQKWLGISGGSGTGGTGGKLYKHFLTISIQGQLCDFELIMHTSEPITYDNFEGNMSKYLCSRLCYVGEPPELYFIVESFTKSDITLVNYVEGYARIYGELEPNVEGAATYIVGDEAREL